MRSARSLLLALALTAISARAGEDDGDAPLVRPDDPRGRQHARALIQGPRTAEEELARLNAAHAEARRYGVGLGRGPRAESAVQGQAWVNLGPTTGYHTTTPAEVRIDSGRARKIVPHPTDPNILYFATSGGGVWKSFNAQAAITNNGGPNGAPTGPSWFPITEGIGSLSVGAFALDPGNPDNLFLGLGDPFDVRTPGFLTSNDGGATWSAPAALQSSFGSGGAPFIATSVRDIVVAPDNSQVVLVATDVGLFRSADGGLGQSFQGIDLTGTHNPLSVWSIAWIGPGNWLVTSEGDLWRTGDNGATWSRATGSLPGSAQGDVSRMTLAAARPDALGPGGTRVYLLAANGAGDDQKDVFVSSDGGGSWNSLNMIATSACGPSSCNKPTNPNPGSQPDLDVLHDQAWYNQAIIVDPRNKDVVFIGGNLSLLRTRNGGQTWDVVADWLPGLGGLNPLSGRLPYVHADWHAMAISTTGAHAVFYAGTDGGLFSSTDHAYSPNCVNPLTPTCSVFTAPAGTSSNTQAGQAMPSFEDRLNRGIVTHLAYSLAMDEHDSSNPVLIGGLQDNGTRLRAVGASLPTSFDEIMLGDGFGVGIGINNDLAYTPAACNNRWGSILIGSIYTSLSRSIECGAPNTFSVAMQGICALPNALASGSGGPCNIDYGSNFIMKVASGVADSKGKTFATVINNSNCDGNPNQCAPVAGYNNVYVSTNGAVSWTQANGTIHLSGGGTATHFLSQLYFVGFDPRNASHLATCDSDHAYTTTDAGLNWTQGFIGAGVTSVAFDPADPSGKTLWASARSGALIYQSTDGGVSWAARAGSGAGALPPVPANVVRVDPNSSSTIYLGTEIGLYRSTDAGSTWARYGTGLPLVSVTEMNIALDSSAIRVSTFGRGFWELYRSSSAPVGAYGNGDFDHSQIIDGVDLIREAAVLGTSPIDNDYDATGNLTGSTNGIDDADLAALLAKFGGRP